MNWLFNAVIYFLTSDWTLVSNKQQQVSSINVTCVNFTLEMCRSLGFESVLDNILFTARHCTRYGYWLDGYSDQFATLNMSDFNTYRQYHACNGNLLIPYIFIMGTLIFLLNCLLVETPPHPYPLLPPLAVVHAPPDIAAAA